MNNWSDDLTISKAGFEDISQIVILVNSAFRGEYSKKGWTTEADLLDGVRTDADTLDVMMREENSLILKCTNEKNQLIGCVYLKEQPDKLYLGMLTVSPELQNAGIGKKLMIASENYSKEKLCKSIMMTVISIRTELIDWYERHGYKKTGEKKPFPDNPTFGIPQQKLEFIVLEKQIQD